MIDPLVADVFSALCSLETAPNRPALVTQAAGLGARFGFGSIMIATHTGGSQIDGSARVAVLATNWPAGLLSRYEADRRWLHDASLRETVERRRPVTLGEAAAWAQDENERSLLAEFAQAGFARGLVVPVLWAGRVTGSVSAFGSGSESDRDAQTAFAIVAPTMVRRALALAPEQGVDRPRNIARPTKRELECLSLSAGGKSSAEIAQLLHLSEHTVNTHLRSAIDRLRAASRVQAVAEAMRRGWIN